MRFNVPTEQPTGFRRLAQYLSGRSRDTSPDRVAWIEARNLQSKDPDVAGRAMEGTAAQSRRCKQPAWHFVVSFDPKDDAAGRVDDATMRRVANDTIDRMGLSGHQMLVYAHRDREHRHVHFLVNRVHPETGKAYSRHNDGQRLHSLGREIARERGLNVAREPERERARDRVDDLHCGPGGTRVDALDGRDGEQDERPARRAPDGGEIRQAEREEREPEPYMPKAEIQRLREDLKPAFRDAQSWDELREELSQHGLHMAPKGQGLIISDGERYAKLSDMGKHARLKRFEERFGERYASFAAREFQRLRQREDDSRRPETVAERANRKPIELLDEADRDTLEARAMSRTYFKLGRQVRRGAKQRRQLRERRDRYRQSARQRHRELYRALAANYRNPNRAYRRWLRLEREHGPQQTMAIVRKHPGILGRKPPKRQQASRGKPLSVHLLLRRKQAWQKVRDRMKRTSRELRQARARLERARRDYRMVARTVGTPDAVRRLMRAKVRARARALERVSERMVRDSRIADRRKAQLARAARGYKRDRERRRRERERRRGRGR